MICILHLQETFLNILSICHCQLSFRQCGVLEWRNIKKQHIQARKADEVGWLCGGIKMDSLVTERRTPREE